MANLTPTEWRIEPYGEQGCMIYLGDSINDQHPKQIKQLVQRLQPTLTKGLILEVIPSYCSLLLLYNVKRIDFTQCQRLAQQALAQLTHETDNAATRTHLLPVCYHPKLAPDLVSMAQHKALSVTQLIQQHSQIPYQVHALGFSPAFAYLGTLPPSLSIPRHANPRLKVPAGSLGIADQQTAIYPTEGPGGWQLIGRTPIDLSLNQPSNLERFQVGDRVRFIPISLAAFDALQN